MTPVLKKLENKRYIERNRSKEDERNLIVCITEKGLELRKEAKKVPNQIAQCIPLDSSQAKELYQLLYKVLKLMKQ